jgi:STE24 endopeptidase
MPISSKFSLFIALAIIAIGCIHLWLSSRQIAAIRRHRDTVPPTFTEAISLAEHHKAGEYTTAKVTNDLIIWGWSTVCLVGWTFMGGLSWLNQTMHTVQTAPSDALFTSTCVALAVLAIGALLDLPLSWYRQFVVQQRFGFNNQTGPAWLVDQLKGAFIAALLGIPVIAAVIALMQSGFSGWWLGLWLGWSAFSLCLMVIFPLWIAPRFNQFTPLPLGELQEKIDQLLQQCGFASSGVFVMDGSTRSAQANAYFTGIGRSKRVVLFDTLIAQLTPPQLLAVLAHELGHYHHKHVKYRLLTSLAMSFAGCALLGFLTGETWFYTGLGVQPVIEGSNAGAALVLFGFLLPILAFPLGPLMSAWSRRQEFEADAFAASHASASDLASALIALYKSNANTLTPDPLYSRWFASHPTVLERIHALGPVMTPTAPTHSAIAHSA